MKTLKSIAWLILSALSIANVAKAQTTVDPSYGFNPSSKLLLASDGNYYGENLMGGPQSGGTIFKFSSTGVLTVFHSFTQNSTTDGYGPTGGLTQGSDGFIYGTTGGGGANGKGTVFKLSMTGTLSTLYSFNSGSDGNKPSGGVIEGSDTNIYGTTLFGGTLDLGTVFKVTQSGSETVLHSFTTSEGNNPGSLLVQGSDGTLYGTTFAGGTNHWGTAFSITTGGTFTTLVSFNLGTGSASGQGGSPGSNLVLQGSILYGTTDVGSVNGGGTVFQLTTGGSLTNLAELNAGDDAANGGEVNPDVILASDNNFYATAYNRNTNEAVIYKLTQGGTLSTLATLTPASLPIGLVEGSDGNLYGTTQTGPAASAGTIFKLTKSGVTTTLVVFSGTYPNDTPTMPVWGAFLLAGLLFVIGAGWKNSFLMPKRS